MLTGARGADLCLASVAYEAARALAVRSRPVHATSPTILAWGRHASIGITRAGRSPATLAAACPRHDVKAAAARTVARALVVMLAALGKHTEARHDLQVEQ